MLTPHRPGATLLHPRRTTGSEGFTLAEILTVLALIGLLVVASSPTFVRMLRDRRVSRAASTLVDYLRTARTMAIGRGQPILVTWNGAGVLAATHPGGTGYLEMDEPIIAKNNMANTCSMTAWRTATTQMVNNFDLQNGKYDYTSITFYDEGGATPKGVDICYSPTGRMFIRTAASGLATGAFAPVMGVPSFAVFNQDTNKTLTLTISGGATSPVGAVGARWVYVLPNGVARMQL